MTTLFDQIPVLETASNSAYMPILEQVAPGITEILDRLQTEDEIWPDTLQRNLGFIDATSEQVHMLNVLAERARGGSAPPTLDYLTRGFPVAEKVSGEALLKVFSICAVAYNFLRD